MRLRTVIIVVILICGIWLLTLSRGTTTTTTNSRHEAVQTPEDPGTTERAPASDATSTSPAKPAVAQSKLTVDQLAQAIRDNRYCDENGEQILGTNLTLAKVSGGPPDSGQRIRFIYEALLKAVSPGTAMNPCLLAFTATDRAESLRYSESSTDAACRFITALTLTEQTFHISNSKSTPEDRDRGIAILTGLNLEDPENGIYPFFLAGAFGTESKSALKAGAINDFFKSTRFDNPVNRLLVEALALGDRNGTAYLFAVEIRSSINFPAYQYAGGVIRDAITEDLTPAMVDWSERLAQWLEDLEKEKISEPVVSLADLSYLKMAATLVYKTSSGSQDHYPHALKDEFWLPFFRRVAHSADIAESYGELMASTCPALLAQANKMYIPNLAALRDERQRYEDMSRN